jgi:hypothetical protein
MVCTGIITRKNDDTYEPALRAKIQAAKDEINRYNRQNGTDFVADDFKSVSISYLDDDGNVIMDDGFNRGTDKYTYSCDFYRDKFGEFVLDIGDPINTDELTFAFTAYVDKNKDLFFEFPEKTDAGDDTSTSGENVKKDPIQCDFYKDENGNFEIDSLGLDKTRFVYAFTAYIDENGKLEIR